MKQALTMWNMAPMALSGPQGIWDFEHFGLQIFE